MNSTGIKKEFKGNLGLFLVCVELTKMNMIALPTTRNTRGFDLVVLQPDTSKSIGIQVKCSDQKQYPVFSSYWYNYKDLVAKKIISPFVFVDISVIEKPEYFILSRSEVFSIINTDIENYITCYLKRKDVTLDDIHGKEKAKSKRPDNWVLKHAEIAGYRNKWSSIVDHIKTA